MDFNPNNPNNLQTPNNPSPVNPATPAAPSPATTPAKPVDSFGYPVPEKPVAPVTPNTQLNGAAIQQNQPINRNPVNPYSNAQNTGYNPNMNTGYQNPNVSPYTPYTNPNINNDLEEPLSVGQWLITMLIMAIPCVNIVMLFVYAFGSGNKGRSNYFKASLIMAGISFVLAFVLGFIFATLGINMEDALYSMY